MTAPPVLSLPDLDVQNTGAAYPPTLSASSVVAGGSVTLTYRLSNFGTVGAPSSVTGIYRSSDSTISTGDTQIGTDANASLAANTGQTETFTINTTGWAAGTYYIGAVADYNNAITESNESNNPSSGVLLTVTAPGAGGSTIGFRDPVGDGSVTVISSDADGYYALRVFLQPDLDDGDTFGDRHLGTDWNADTDADELAYASYGGTIAYANANALSDRGGVVMLNHTLPDGRQFTTVYMHLEHIPASILNGTQTRVSQGEFLGDSGFVRQDWGLHLHYEVRAGHQTGLDGVAFGYIGGNTFASIVNRGTIDGVSYADILTHTGATVRYFDPVEFTEQFRTLQTPSMSNFPTEPLAQAEVGWKIANDFTIDSYAETMMFSSRATFYDEYIYNDVISENNVAQFGFHSDIVGQPYDIAESIPMAAFQQISTNYVYSVSMFETYL